MSRPKGRPKGSKTQEYIPIREIPPKCPRCGSTDREVIKGYSPVINNIAGADFDRVVRRRVRCQCGQLLQISTYEKLTNAVSLAH